jgi:hypothetical protein
MKNLLTLQFWLNGHPGPLTFLSSLALIILIVILLASAITFYFLKSKRGFYGQLWGKLGNFSIANTLISSILFFFGKEEIPLLSARFWYLLYLAGIIVWLIFIIRYAKTLPAKKKELQKDREFQKYIP